MVPLFGRGGSIIRLGPVMQRTEERPLDHLTLLVYAGAPGACTIYEDDGATQAYRDGQHALSEVRSSFDDGVVRVTVGAVTGAYAGQPSTRDLTVRIRSADRPRQVQVRRGDHDVDVPERPAQPDSGATASWSYEGPGWVQIHVPGTDPRQAVTVQLSQ